MSEEKRKNSTLSSEHRGAYILIGLGVIFLLVNILDINFGRLWPLLLVAVGVYMLAGRGSAGSAVLKKGRFRAPREDAQSAEVELHLAVGEAWVEPLASAEDLIDADLTYVGEIDLEVSGTDHKMVRLHQTGDSMWVWLNPAHWFGTMEHYEWHIGLNRELPTRLVVHGGAGKAQLNLRDLNVTDVRLHGGAGQFSAALPASEAGYSARIHGGVGEIQLTVPASTSAMLEIKGGVGTVGIALDQGTAVRLKARGGIGSVRVPSRLVRLSGGQAEFELGQSGVWETEGFENAEHQVVINYEGGIGELRVN